MSIELLDMNHRDAIIEAFEKAKGQIRIISPFVQDAMTRYLVDSAGRGITSQLITRFYREDFIRSVSSLTALKSLQTAGVAIYALKDLHAKLYLFDDNVAIIGSANFTSGGFGNNIELSLYIEDEYDIIERLSRYFDQLLSGIQAAGDFKITDTNIENESLIVQKAIKGRDHTSKANPTRFGAEVNATQVPVATPVDEVENILGVPDESISAVLKFEGAAHRRIDPDGKYEPNHYDRKGIYFTASSKSPRSLTADTTVFLSAVSWDKSGAGVPIIVGRAKTRGFDPDNVTDATLIKEHPWAVDYPFYVELYDIETVDTEIRNCVSLNDLIAEVGYKLYPSTEKNPATPIPSLKTRHHRKAYIAITTYAANRINAMLASLFKKYGKSTF
ncbi:MAG: phospholipase D family protein [Bacillota bacterium]|nr:phospholipase D family protein [Bacillota bacterium]